MAVMLIGRGSLTAAAAGAADFDTVPDQPPAQLLPATMVSGESFHVVDPVHGDGLMNRFVLESRYGRFEAYGRVALAKRVWEVKALNELARTSQIEIVAGGVEHGIESEVKTAVGVVTHPVSTVTGIPKGIAHLFNGYTARGQEALASAQAAGSAGSGGHTAHREVQKGEEEARRYAERYLGITSAERGWYKRLAVDPYTDNTVLRDAIRKAARTEAVGSFGGKFLSLPAIPGIAITQRVVDAIYNEDPAALRARLRKTLAGYGLSPGEIEAWLNAPVMSPTRQVLLLSAAEALTGVAGRAELFRHSRDFTSDAEAQVYLLSAGLLVQAHGAHALELIIPGVRLPAAERADHSLVVCGAFDAVYWTSEVAQLEEQLQRSLPPQPESAGRELRLAGTLSDRARSALRERGWSLHEVADAAAPQPR